MSGTRYERDLSAYYDQEAAHRATSSPQPARIERRSAFIEQVRQEGCETVVEVGVGPGHDAVAFSQRGIWPVGLDLSLEHARFARSNGVTSLRGTVLALPFPDGIFDCGWTMSTLLHVPDADFGRAMNELTRVLRDGAPLAVGLWGGFDREAISDFDRIDPPRFFSLRSHERARAMLAEHGEIERFDTWGDDRSTWEYQFAVIRVRHR